MEPETMRDALERVFALMSERGLLEETYRFVSVPSPTGDEAAFALRADLSIDQLEVGSTP
jgi:hypothetical protein